MEDKYELLVPEGDNMNFCEYYYSVCGSNSDIAFYFTHNLITNKREVYCVIPKLTYIKLFVHCNKDQTCPDSVKQHFQKFKLMKPDNFVVYCVFPIVPEFFEAKEQKFVKNNKCKELYSLFEKNKINSKCWTEEMYGSCGLKNCIFH